MFNGTHNALPKAFVNHLNNFFSAEKEQINESKNSFEKRNVNNTFKTNSKPNYKPNSDRSKNPYEDKRNNSEFREPKNQSRKNYDSLKTFNKYESTDKRNYSDKNQQFGKFDSKKPYDNSFRTDKSFGNFKYNKFEQKNGNGDFSSRNEFSKNKMSEKRGQNNINQSAIKNYNRPMDLTDSKKPSSFVQANEKPPRFQKYQNQMNENQNVQNWNDQNYSRIQQNDYQLQNSIANLTLQQNIANFQNQNSQDGYGDSLSGTVIKKLKILNYGMIFIDFDIVGVPTSSAKPNNMFYQNVVLPTSQSNDNRIYGNQNNQPPPPPPQSHMNTYGNRNAGGYIQEVKNSAFSTIPNIAEVAFKNNGPLLHGK